MHVGGDNVKVIARLAGQSKDPAHTFSFAGGGGFVQCSGRSNSQTYTVDNVITDQRRHVDTISNCQPYALGVCAGSNTSIMNAVSQHCSTTMSMFEESDCVALHLMNSVATDAGRRGVPAYLAMGVIPDPSKPQVIDLIRSEGKLSKPVSIDCLPSLSSKTFLPDMLEVNVSGLKRREEVFCKAMQTFHFLKSRLIIPRRCVIFATISIPTSTDHQLSAVSTLSIIEGDLSIVDKLSRHANAMDPYLGADVVALLFFGLRMSHRALLIVSLSSSGTEMECSALELASAVRSVVTVPADSEQFAAPSKPLDTDEMREFLHARELMIYRLNLRTLSQHSASQDVLFQQLQGDFSTLIDAFHRLEHRILDVLPDVIPEISADANTDKVLRTRFEAVREMETKQERERLRLTNWQRELLAFPTIHEGGVAWMASDTRVQLLETTIRTLQEENDRLKTIFARDLNILKIELDAARSRAAVVRGGNTKAARTPFTATIETFIEESEILQRRGFDGGRGQMFALIDQLAVDLRHTTEMFYSPSEDKPDAQFSQLSSESLFVRAALDKARRSLGIPLAPPEHAMGSDVTPLNYWKQLVFERASCRAERWSLQNIAKGLSLTVSRLVDEFDQFGCVVNDMAVGAPEDARIVARQPRSRVQEEVDRLLQLENVNTKYAQPAQAGDFSLPLREWWGRLSLIIQRCKSFEVLLQGINVDIPSESVEDEHQTPLMFDMINVIPGTLSFGEKNPAILQQENTITTSLDGILRGDYRKVNSQKTPPPKTSQSGKMVARGFFSSEISGQKGPH